MGASFVQRASRGALVGSLLILMTACRQSPETGNTAGDMAGPAENAAETVESSEEAATVAGGARDGPEVAAPLVPRGEVTFRSVADTDQQGASVEAALRNGEPVPLDSIDWQASFVTEFTGDNGPETCTSAMIGPGVMLTAAHCVPDSLKVEFSFNNMRFPMTCVRHPKWDSGTDPSADYGLCVLSDRTKPFVPPPTFRYETVDVSPMAQLAQTRAPIILTGYGCISDTVTQRRIDGRYRIGRNVVIATSDSAQPRPPYPGTYFGPNGQRNNLFTADTGANICPGDSGGPAFSAGASGRDPRRIVAVNSRVFFDPRDRQRYGASLLAATGSADFGAWARKWLSDRRLAACGLSGAPRGCRS